MMQTKTLTRAGALSLLGLCALVAGGCGGGSTNGDTLGTTPAAGPNIESVLGLVSNTTPSSGDSVGVLSQLSGFGLLTNPGQPTSSDLAYRTIETDQRTLVGKDPLANGVGSGAYPNVTSNYGGIAVPVGGQFALRADIVNGQAAGSRDVIPIATGKTVLTSSEISGFSVPINFAFKSDGSAAGPFASATYATANVTEPFSTTGLHNLTATVTDTTGQSVATDFQVAVVSPTDGAAVVQVYFPDPDGDPISGGALAVPQGSATVTITNPVTGAQDQPDTDAAGLATLFAAPGTQTISVTYTYTDAKKVVHKYTGSATVNLVAGKTDTSLQGAKAIVLTEVKPVAPAIRRS